MAKQYTNGFLFAVFAFLFGVQTSFGQQVDPEFDQKAAMRRFLTLKSHLDDLADKEFAKEVGLVEAQLKEIDALRKWVDEQLNPLMIPRDHIRDPVEYKNDWMLAIKGLDERKDAVRLILLPHQKLAFRHVKQLRAIGLHKGASGLTDGPLAKSLGLTKEQKLKIKRIDDDMNDAVSTIQDDLLKAQSKIKKKYSKQSKSVLTPSQSRIYRDLFGEPFEVDK